MSTEQMTDDEILAALDDLRLGLEADGYRLAVSQPSAGVVAVDVSAADGACEDCLVPKELFVQMVEMSLPPGLAVDRVVATYPDETQPPGTP